MCSRSLDVHGYFLVSFTFSELPWFFRFFFLSFFIEFILGVSQFVAVIMHAYTSFKRKTRIPNSSDPIDCFSYSVQEIL